MNDYCINLNVDIPLFKDLTLFEKLKSKSHTQIDVNDFHPSLINFFDSLDLEITFAESFYRDPKLSKVSLIHKDAFEITDATKINWVIGGSDSVMNWYQIINNNVKTSKTPLGIEYSFYDKKDLKLLHSQAVGYPSLVQVGIPHNVSVGSQQRHCISAFFKYKNSKYFIPFLESSEIFKGYLK